MRRSVRPKPLLRYSRLFFKDFVKDLFDEELGHYASSLSWSTIFALFPLLALILFVFSSLPLFEGLRVHFMDTLSTNLLPNHSKVLIAYIESFLESTHKLGFLGGIYVCVAIILFFKNYDYIVNAIFGLPSRNVLHALRLYSLLILIIPLLLSSTIYSITLIQAHITNKQVMSIGYYLFPFLLTWVVFYIAYQLSANTHIKFKAALLSSLSASSVWILSKSAFIIYVVYNKTYASIYGNISILLFLFLWIYISWLIFLHGLKFCYMLTKNPELR
jgi:membrane protein